jgi:hypothetical protein
MVKPLLQIRLGSLGTYLAIAFLIPCLGFRTAWGAEAAGTSVGTAGGNPASPGAAGWGFGHNLEALPLVPFPVSRKVVESPIENENGVDWKGLAGGSWRFMTIMQGYRLGTERGTRQGMKGAFLDNYASAVEGMHGWADGDEFYVNYVGHPMQGAVSGYIWVHNDRQYRRAEFGRNRYYWKSRLRAAGYAWAYSAQFELGPISEASLGAIQKEPPAQGFVDHVITPAIGMAWMIGEDALDQYLIKPIEARTNNRMIRRLARAGLNPARSFANLMTGSYPWHRETRPGVSRYDPKMDKWLVESGFIKSAAPPPIEQIPDEAGPAPFELTISFQPERFFGGGSSTLCLGGGGTAAFRVSPSWQWVADVGGCKMLDLGTNLSGDSLTYMMGPRWIGRTKGPLSSYVQVLVGGNKLTEQLVYPEKERLLKQEALEKGLKPPDPLEFIDQTDTNGFAVSFGGGVQYKLNAALAIRVADISYSHSWVAPLGGRDFSNGLKVTTGFVLRWGAW